ncbi:4809_t:CDS:2 [Gigaspora rosea]|nr:4809_t:CDS:2 [Gigaspora rosea]
MPTKRFNITMFWVLSRELISINHQNSLDRIKMFSIVQFQTACERNFSILKWFYGDRRNRLTIKRIESMAKLRMYWLSEIRKELELYGKDLTEEELRACTNIATIPINLSSELIYLIQMTYSMM